MKSNRRVPPVWLMGLSNASFGLYGGIAFFAIPQLLATRHVSEATIAGITAMALSPNFWAVVFGPMLDVRFSRRWYATAFAALASVLVFIAVINLSHLVVLESRAGRGFRGSHSVNDCAWRMAFYGLP